MPPPSSSHELPVYARMGVEIAYGKGVTVVTADGDELLDFYGGHAVALLGYRHPSLLEALRKQSERLFFQTNAVELAVRREACDRLAAFAPEGLGRVLLLNSGAEANENALRLALRLTGRKKVVALEGGFHGRTAAAAAVSHGSGKWYGFPRTPFEVAFVPPDDLDALDRALDPDVAALILEPVQGMAGARDLSLDYLREARNLTRERGSWLIADEVQCGMGRSGSPFVCQAAGIVPDALTTAKGLGGGFPCAALMVGEAVAAAIKVGDLGTTFGGGPMACALVVAVLDVLESSGFLARVGKLEALIRKTCRVGPVTDIQGRGLLLGLKVSRPAKDLLPELRSRGVLAGGANDPQVIRLVPPLTLAEEHVRTLAKALEEIGA